MLFNLPEDDEWRDVPGYEGSYQVSRSGKVRSVGKRIKTKLGHYQNYPPKVLKPYEGQVYLSSEGVVETVRVCNIVASVYLDGYKSGDKVYHIGSESDDSVDNLSLILPRNNDITSESNWKDIPDYEGYYQASDGGHIRSVDRCIEFTRFGRQESAFRKGKQLSENLGKDGYYHVMLSVDGQSKFMPVHRLVATAFLPNPDNLPQVNHINGVKTDNVVSNLEWVTQSENMQHAKNLGLWDPNKCGNISMMLTGKRVRCLTDGRIYGSINKAASYYNMDWQSIKESIELNRPRKGYMFEFIED